MNERSNTSDCVLTDEAELDRRIAATRATPSRLRDFERRIEMARGIGEQEGQSLARLRARFNEARLIHKYVHQTPFRDSSRRRRSGQWEEVLARYRHLGNLDLIDWLRLQVEVARNLEEGIQDMRPRRNGPTWFVLLEHVANTKRKALAVLHWAMDSEVTGRAVIDSRHHARTESILERGSEGYDAHDGGHEAVPWKLGEE